MKLQHIKLLIALGWVVLAIILFVATGSVTSTTNRALIAFFGVVPPIVLWFWWTDPVQTMSESIHKVRD